MKKHDSKVTPVFETLAILDAARKEVESNVTLPSIQAVKEAKEWVDENEK